MIRIELDVATMGRVHWRYSPLAELLGWLGRSPHERAFPGPARTMFLDPALVMLTQLLPVGFLGSTPDFLTPSPSRLPATKTLLAQLDELAAAPPEIVHTQVGEHFQQTTMPDEVARQVEAGIFAATIAAALRRVWYDEFAAKFSVIRTGLEDDLSHRGDILASHGLGAAFESLHPRFAWNPHAGLEYTTPTWDEKIRLADTDLVVVPSLLFYGSNVSFQVCNKASHAIISYPANPRLRGAGVANSLRPRSLIGSSRSRVLSALRSPSTTTSLSAELQLSSATVSYHLGVLHDSGLATRIPRGRHVLYAITPAGRAFLASGSNARDDEIRATS